MNENLKVHPEIANLFPRMSAEERAALKRSILKKKAVLQNIITWTDPKGKQFIIDGANRWDVVQEIDRVGIAESIAEMGIDADEIESDAKKIDVAFFEFEGTELEALEYAMSLNADRRHLTSSQKAAIAVSHAMLERKYERKAQGLRSGKKDLMEDDESNFAAKLAEQAGTNRAYIYDCLMFAREQPDILEKIRRGDMNIPAGKEEMARRVVTERAMEIRKEAGVKEPEPKKESKKEAASTTSTVKAKSKSKEPSAEGGEESEPATEAIPRPDLQDGAGNPVPESLRSEFEARIRFKRLAADIRAAASEAEKLANHPSGVWMRGDEVRVDFRNLSRSILDCQPFAVCPVCKGNGKNPANVRSKCEVCKGNCFLDKLQFRAFAKGGDLQGDDDE